MRGRSGPDKGLQSGRISALAGRQGRLRACMRDVHWFLLVFISSQVLNCQLLNRGGPFGVPIQWLTTAHKIPCWRGDGSRSGPSPCKARRDITPLNSLVTSSIIKSHSVPGLWPGAARLFSGECGRVFSWCPVGARRLWRWEVLLILSGAAEAAASEGLIYAQWFQRQRISL